jgi:hypothetical protein
MTKKRKEKKNEWINKQKCKISLCNWHKLQIPYQN